MKIKENKLLKIFHKFKTKISKTNPDQGIIMQKFRILNRNIQNNKPLVILKKELKTDLVSCWILPNNNHLFIQDPNNIIENNTDWINISKKKPQFLDLLLCQKVKEYHMDQNRINQGLMCLQFRITFRRKKVSI